MMLAKSLQSAAGNAAGEANYIEDVFSTWLYTGNGSTQTITNGIDLAGEGGLVWLKGRSFASNPAFYDTARGVQRPLSSNLTNGQDSDAGGGSTSGLYAFNSDGFSLGPNWAVSINSSGQTFASWTFRKQPKFFDVVTWTGDNTDNRAIAHALDAAPGFIIIKATNATDSWQALTKFETTNYIELILNSTIEGTTRDYAANQFLSARPSTTTFTVNSSYNNASGTTYVAYLFAHNAGGFGLTGTDNVISCGSFTTDGSENSTTNLGYEPQWLLLKATAGGTAASQPWHIFDNMRGLTVAGQDDASLQPNNSNAESQVNRIGITSTGFTTNAFGANTSFIYIAIRRGPMKVPESGTKVFFPSVQDDTTTITTGFPADAIISFNRPGGNSYSPSFGSRLTSPNSLVTSSTAAETSGLVGSGSWPNNTGSLISCWGSDAASEIFRRAPSVFDVVCYTGTGSARTVTHNLGAVPELMIVKSRGNTGQWVVYNKSLGGGTSPEDYVLLVNSTSAQVGPNVVYWNSTNPSSAEFTVGTNSNVNTSGNTYVAYLFASCPGVSKCGSFTGNGSSQTINCGFTAGARFVLVKATSTTGDWLVADSARGIVSGNDPYLELNTTNAEVTGEDWLDTDSSGFVVNEVAGSNANTNGVTYIYLAIA